ncbi:unnamed protein product [Auanema sp. JU1783]|nr:unnamed protein product [Auanema sp. JU1783]
MVCIPCVFLPIALAIYLKFIQPFVYRLMPQSWINFLDKYLFPTCPIQQPEQSTRKDEGDPTCCSSQTEGNKKDE